MGIPEVEELQKHAKNYSLLISPRVTIVIETKLYINYVLSIQSVLDIINPVVTSVYE